MKNRASILAGTALALVMTAATAAALPTLSEYQTGKLSHSDHRSTGYLLLAQAEAESEGELTEEELLRLRQQQQEEQEQQAPADEAPAPVDEPQPEPEPEPQPEPEQAPVEELTPEQAPVPQEAPADAPPAEEVTPEEVPVPEEAPAEQPAPEEAPVPEEAPAEEPVELPTPEEVPAPEPAPAPQEQPPADAPVEQPADEAVPAESDPAQPAPSEPTEPAPAQPEATPPAAVEQPAEGEAPLLDSEKEAPVAEPGQAGEAPAAAPAPVDAGPPPTTDAEAQQLDVPVQVESLRAEEGRRIERREERVERREGTDVLREIGDRIILQFNNQTIVQSDDRGRLERDASEVYYEELPRGRTRETIVRANGVQVVTIRDRYGDIVRRSRVMPDGREYVLVYGDERERDERRVWRDPGRDLPPLRLTIPRDEYILDARNVREPDDYYDFFERPPVERVRRLYTVDEVRYSARVRDSVRRVDLDTITFDFGAASIAESEIRRLEGVATAMERLLDENPAETFLIEGHTDAVGSDQANLALSDRRAESVAAALTNVFGIPPENLVTQGYGERYLKVNTQEPERANRRVAMRRITPLVSPVAEAR